jgi:hypothetical protein
MMGPAMSGPGDSSFKFMFNCGSSAKAVSAPNARSGRSSRSILGLSLPDLAISSANRSKPCASTGSHPGVA